MKKHLLLLVPMALLAGASKPSQDLYVLSREYSVTIDGTSNLRDWKETVGEVSGFMEAAVNEDGSVILRSIRINMEVLSIRSDMGRVMDSKTYDALKATAHPQILFRLDAPFRLSQMRNCATAIPIKGNLSLAGVCKPVTMLVTTIEITQGKLFFEGRQNLKMTDFGVKPPSALFGTMRASPDITIHFKTDFINQSISNNLKN
jgi:polyisoprenoid-binding protein YceI